MSKQDTEACWECETTDFPHAENADQTWECPDCGQSYRVVEARRGPLAWEYVEETP